MPGSLIGSRADLLVEIVVLAQLFALPGLVFSIRAAREGRIQTHKRIQCALAIIFGIAVLALEVDIRLAGGTAALVRGGAYEGTTLLAVTLYGHLAIAALNALLWIALPLISLARARKGHLPGDFSQAHRRAGRLAAITFVATSLSGVFLYLIAFLF